MHNVQVAILAGGLGTRLQSVVADRNKVVADIDGKPFLDFLLYRIESFGFEEVIICSGHKHEDLFFRLGERYSSLNLIFSKESKPLGTAGALRHALPLFSSATIVVLNGDSYCDLDLKQLITQHQKRSSLATLSAVWVNDTCRYGKLVIDINDKVVEFKEKDLNTGPGYINAGIYALNIELIETIPHDQFISLEQHIFPQQAKKNAIDVFYHSGQFIDIGTVESYKQAQSFFKSIELFNTN